MKKLIVSLAALCLSLPCFASSDPMSGYLFAYFEGRGEGYLQEHLRFAVCEDAVNWKALNRNYPVIDSGTISETGGIRDPHILRAEDGKSFLMVATDMNTVRDGWGSNPGIVMMKSNDLTTWNLPWVP